MTFVLIAWYADLKPGVHHHSDFGLLLTTFVITTRYSDLKPGVRSLGVAGNLRPQVLEITGPQGLRHRTPALKRRGGMGAAVEFAAAQPIAACWTNYMC